MSRFALLLALLLALLPCASYSQIAYTLEPQPAARSIRVSVAVTSDAESVDFRIPAWCPGFYFIQNYRNKIFDVRAADPSGAELTVSKGDSRAWQVKNPHRGKVVFSYRVQGDDGGLGFFGVNVRQNTTFVNGPAAFVYVPGRLTEPCTLSVRLPSGWDVATGLQSTGAGAFEAGGYDELIDCPIELGKFVRKKFTVEGIPFEAVFTSTDQTYAPDLDSQTKMLAAVSAPAIRMFGGAPFKRYLYIVHLAVGGFGGGLEHRNSTVLAVPNSPGLDMDTLAAHEFFHAWNVKQMRPAVLGPFDYTQPVRTGNLWFAEGVTDYYAHLLVYRSGRGDEEWLLSQLGRNIAQLQASRIRKSKTLEEVCREAWENGGFGVGDLSYYTKGLVAGFVFDAAIRSSTGGAKSLDDVMRLLMERHRLPKPGYSEDGLRETINEVAGRDLSSLYHTVVRSTNEVPYELLRGIGLVLSSSNELSFDPDATETAVQLRNGWLARPAG